ncbi:MAG: glycosyltransferase family 9 protein [Deltaproteobacteria bacterium]|nr:glycosyltransferase family 9 protein [Deltaproteobacteria bacterium]
MNFQAKILIRGPNWIGDHVMARPFYRGLRQLYPKNHLALLCPLELSELPLESFDEVIPIAPARRPFPKILSYAKVLLAKKFDLAITLPASLSSACLLFAARIPSRIGYFQGPARLFLTEGLEWKGPKSLRHKSSLYMELLVWMAAGNPIGLSTDWTGSARTSRAKIIVVAPGAALPLREWPYFPELVKQMSERYPDYRIITVGSPREEKWSSRFRRCQLKVEDRIGKTTLTQLVDLCAQASLVIANDSGVAHLAASVAGVPTVVLFGPGDPRYVTPLGDRVCVVRTELPCSPCESPRCRAPYGYQRCLKDLSVGKVLEAVNELIGNVTGGEK